MNKELIARIRGNLLSTAALNLHTSSGAEQNSFSTTTFLGTLNKQDKSGEKHSIVYTGGNGNGWSYADHQEALASHFAPKAANETSKKMKN